MAAKFKLYFAVTVSNKPHFFCLYTLIAFFGLLISAPGCGQNYNSQSGDSFRGSTSSCTGDAALRFCAARSILINKCVSCHSWASYSTEEQWLQSSRVIAGNIEASTVITRLTNHGSNMPLGGGALSSGDYEALKSWVALLVPTP